MPARGDLQPQQHRESGRAGHRGWASGSSSVSPRHGVTEPLQAQEAQRQPLQREQLQVAECGDSVGEAGEDHTGQEGGRNAPRVPADEQIRPPAAENEAEQIREVVGDDRLAGEPHHREHSRGGAEQMLGIGQRVGQREEDARIEQARRVHGERVHVPREDPRVQQRIADVAGNRRVQVQPQRVRDDERQQREGQQGKPPPCGRSGQPRACAPDHGSTSTGVSSTTRSPATGLPPASVTGSRRPSSARYIPTATR